jgi:hypothetical protein
MLVCAMALPMYCHAQQEESSKAIETKACGDKEVNFSQKTEKHDHTMGVQAADKALIYVLRPTMLGMAIQTKLAVDGEWKGVNRGNSYFFFQVAPGEHYFCSRAENHSAIALTVGAGKAYYLQQVIEMGVMKARTSLRVMDDAEAQQKLPKMNLSTWEVK